MQKQIIGQKNQWTLLEQVGKGDAGEVYKVTSPDRSIIAVLKRPSRNATGGSIIRQAVQIENEGRILAILNGIQIKQNKFNLLTPLLLDESDPKTANTSKYFIISQQAEGESLSELLSKARIKRNVFPRELLLKVITSLFSLFENIHLKGVLWNDVKADHIFWDDKSNSIMVIDWGNGVILNDHRSNALWQLDFLDDYKQMIQEFDRLFSSTAPELLWDLGWPQGTLKELDQNAITLLRKRVEFADNYFNLRIIEYHAKVKLLLNKMDSMEALSELIEYVNHLTQIGEIVDYPKILEAAKKLLLLYAQQGNIQDCESILTQVSKLSVENFSTEWTILNEIFSIPEVVRHTAFPIVVENACQLNWVSLFWELGHIAAEKASAAWWDKISRSIRCSVVPTEFGGDYLIELIGEMRNDLHVKTIQSRIVDDSNFNKNELRDLSRMLSDLVAHWIEVDNNTYFGEHLLILRELLPVLDKIGVEVNPLIRSLLTNLQQIIRQLVSAWNSADFFLARQTLMTYFLWDPQFKSSPSLYSSLLKMEKWVKCAYAGPNFPQDGLTFISEMLDSLQALDNNLGTPTWLMEITKGFNEILENKTKLDIQAIQKKYELPFSWLNDERIMSLDLDQSIKFIPLSISQRKALEAFYHDLKSESNIHPSLDLIKFELPQFSLAYETLATAFDSQLFPSQQQVLLLEEVKIPAEDETNFLAAKQTLTVLNNWAKANCDGSFESALALLPEDSDWHIINSCRRVQIKWQEGVLPHLSDIKERHWNQEQYRHNNLEDQDDSLMRNLNLLYEAHQVWLGILEKGLNPKNVYIFSEILEQAQQSYYAFMKSLEHLKELKLFLSCFGDEINARYKQIHQMVKHVQTIKISLEVLARDEMLQTRMAYNSASDLMHSLTKLVESMPNLAGASQVSDWVKTYQQVLAHGKADASNLVISEIDLRHPLLNWFQSLSRNYHD